MGIRAVVTGGMGFIGSQMIRRLRDSDDYDFILNYDKITYSGNTSNCPFTDDKNYKFVKGDICDQKRLAYINVPPPPPS